MLPKESLRTSQSPRPVGAGPLPVGLLHPSCKEPSLNQVGAMGTYHLLIVSRTKGSEGWKALRTAVENNGQRDRWVGCVAFEPVHVLSSPGTHPLLLVAPPNRTCMLPTNGCTCHTVMRGGLLDQAPQLSVPDLLAFSAKRVVPPLTPLCLCPVACRLRDSLLDQIDTQEHPHNDRVKMIPGRSLRKQNQNEWVVAELRSVGVLLSAQLQRCPRAGGVSPTQGGDV